MDTSKEPLFNSTGTITEKELIELYGPMLRGDMVLKLAEHKNFNAAREQFQTWDERSIVEMGNLLGQDYRHQEQPYRTEDKYIAVTFLKALINEWEESRLKKIQARLEDPVQQQQAAELLKIRLSGVLPHIDLAGTDFTIDWRLRQLRETNQPWNHINLEEMEMDEFGKAYLCFYDIINHEIYIPDESITELPEDVVVLEIPYELKLDPVAVARDYGIGETDLLGEHPIQQTLAAKVSPLSQSGLPELIEINLKRRDNNQSNNQRHPNLGR
jgi:hypothetical protein